MTQIQPQTLNPIGTTAYSNYSWNWRSSITNYEIYDLWISGGWQGTDVYSIQVNTSTNTWSDHGSNNPKPVTISGVSHSAVEENSDGTVSLYGITGSYPNGVLLYVFTKPTSASWISSGPTVTSITSAYIVTNDTVTNTDFTLLKNGSAYANTNISLTAATITLPSDAQVAGYTYTITYNGTGVYSRTVDSLSHHAFYWDNSWTSSPSSGRNPNSSSNRILNVLATIPSYITIGTGSDLNGNPNPLTTVFNNVNRVITYTQTATINGVSNEIYINFALDQKSINGQLEVIGTFYESRAVDGYQNVSQDYIIGAQQTMTYTQSLLGDSIEYYVSDWVYSDEIEGDGYVAPVTTTSNGGGKPDRYPIIMTNLFNRNRSLYSIGMTHKDTWDLFL